MTEYYISELCIFEHSGSLTNHTGKNIESQQ